MKVDLTDPCLLTVFRSENSSNSLFISPGYGIKMRDVIPIVTKCLSQTIHNPIRLVKNLISNAYVQITANKKDLKKAQDAIFKSEKISF